MATYKVKEGVNVHKVVAGFGGVDIHPDMPQALIAICIEAKILEYFEEEALAKTNKTLTPATYGTGTAAS